MPFPQPYGHARRFIAAALWLVVVLALAGCVANSRPRDFSGGKLPQPFWGYVRTNAIMEEMPEKTEVDKEMDAYLAVWQAAIKKRQRTYDSAMAAYRSEAFKLTREMQEQRLSTLDSLNQNLNDYQTEVFGEEGLYYQKQSELLLPIQDRIHKAIEEMVEKEDLDFVFDLTDDRTLLYANPVHDYTDFVLEILGHGDERDYAR